MEYCVLISTLIITNIWTIAIGGNIPPAATFIGVGYDLLQGNPDGDSRINLGKDPGILMTRRILKLEPAENPKEISFHDYALCFPAHYNETFIGTKSYQTRLLHDLIDIGNTTSSLFNHAFSLSQGFQNIIKEINSEHYIYQDQISFCNKGRARYMSSLARVKKFNVGDEFAASVCSLPTQFDANVYMNFLKDWGTHIVMEVEIGWEVKTRRRISVNDLMDIALRNNLELLKPTGGYQGSTSSVTLTEDKLLQLLPKIYSRLSFVSNTSKGNDHISEPIKYKVTGIDTALNTDYWQAFADFIDKKVCKAGFDSLLPLWRKNIQKAMDLYPVYMKAPNSSEMSIQSPLKWPDTTFAIPEPLSGCPKDNGPWVKGYIIQSASIPSHNMKLNESFQYSAVHLAGSFSSKKAEMRYCGRSRLDHYTERTSLWPKGSYCFAQASHSVRCPSGFSSGTIQFGLQPDYQSVLWVIEHNGTVPDFSTYRYERYSQQFCCRRDGQVENAIVLPHQDPFYLYPSSNPRQCQKVFGMRSSLEWIKYPITRSNYCSGWPRDFDENCSQYHKIHMCYYVKQPQTTSPVFG